MENISLLGFSRLIQPVMYAVDAEQSLQTIFAAHANISQACKMTHFTATNVAAAGEFPKTKVKLYFVSTVFWVA